MKTGLVREAKKIVMHIKVNDIKVTGTTEQLKNSRFSWVSNMSMVCKTQKKNQRNTNPVVPEV